MKFFTEYVPASEIWHNATNFTDRGLKQGLVRGYNVEVRKLDGTVGWDSCCYIHSEPEEYFLDGYYKYFLEDRGATLTGRICFRGYGIEEYSLEDHDTFVNPCDENGCSLAE